MKHMRNAWKNMVFFVACTVIVLGVKGSCAEETKSSLTEELRSPSYETVRGALFKVKLQRDPRVIPDLVARAQDPSPKIRKEVALALAVFKEKEAQHALVGMLYDKDASVRRHVIMALQSYNDARFIDDVALCAKDPSQEVRISTAEFLREASAQKLEPARTRKMLLALTILSRDSFPFIRRLVAEALAKLHDKDAAALLTRLLKDKDRFVRKNAILGLKEIADEEQKKAIAFMLRDHEKIVRDAAKESLAQFNDTALLGTLTQLLNTGNFFTRYDTAAVLGEYRYEKSLAVLQARLTREPNATVKNIIARSIASVKEGIGQ